jgi:ethanolamine utilization protein EutA
LKKPPPQVTLRLQLKPLVEYPKSLMALNSSKLLNLVGLDFGSTTSSAVFARAAIVKDSVTGRMELGTPEIFFKPAPIFTPFFGPLLDLKALTMTLDDWFRMAGLSGTEVDAGGAIVTGLAAAAANTDQAKTLIRQKIGTAVIATACDPDLESWLAFMGSCQRSSAAFPEQPMINFDIGGGTTNIALGQNSFVSQVGCLWMGARHIQVRPGSYEISALSPYGLKLLAHCGIPKKCGDVLSKVDVRTIMDFYVALLHEMIGGPKVSPAWCIDRSFDAHKNPAILFSGGVGELVYKFATSKFDLPTTKFGDLGIDLAHAILEDPLFRSNIERWQPENMGRATAFGLALHNTSISGATIYLPSDDQLPLSDLPILGEIAVTTPPPELLQLMDRVKKSSHGACIRVKAGLTTASLARELGTKIATAVAEIRLPRNKPVIFLVAENMGKALGSYASNWGRGESTIIIIDELESRRASFINIGSVQQGIVPVSYFGM